MNDFIAKPINPQKLMSTLVQWVTPVAQNAETAEPIVQGLSNTDNLPGFDLHNLLVMLDNNQQLATQLLLDFMDSMKNLPGEIEAMIAAGNRVSARELTHKIKGASGNIGAVRLHAASKILEAELNGELSAATFNTFKLAFNQTMSVITALHQPEVIVPLTGGNRAALKRSAAELDLLLKGNDFISEALLNTLKPHLALDQLDQFARLRKQINELHYDEARKMLTQLTELART